MNKTTSIAIGTLVFTIGLIGWAKYSQPNYHKDMKLTDSEIVSTNGLHWHPKLEIYVNGIKRAIPNNIGMTGGEMALHTHEDTPIVHMEFLKEKVL